MSSKYEVIAPDNEFIHYQGRIDFSNPKQPRFDWPGVSIAAIFTGTTVGIIIEDGGNDYNIFVDGEHHVLVTEKGKTEYVLAKGLKKGEHNLLITKRTEGYDGVAQFEGILLNRGEELRKINKRINLRFEFIGDSISVGFGAEGDGVTCDSERKYKNNYKAYPAVLSRMFDAEFSVIAVSGKGLVKNYGEKEKVSEEPLPAYYDRTLMNDQDLKWDFRGFIPDAVFINLGTNDFSAKPYPDEDVFVEEYVKLIKNARSKYEKAYIVCVSGPAQQQPFHKYISKVIEKAEDSKLMLIRVGSLSDDELGCEWHPNEKAHRRIAEEIQMQIKGLF